MKFDKKVNYYKILDLSSDCSKSDIRSNYRKLSKIHHPDSGGSEIEFSKLLKAYKILSDPDTKKIYDSNSIFGNNYNESTELYDFEFSNTNISGDKYRKDFDKFKKKELIDILLKVKIDKDTEIKYTRYVGCVTCDGSGMDFDDDNCVFECDLCDGCGEYNNNMCPSCMGKGESSIKKCSMCQGDKICEKEEEIIIRIDELVDNKLMIKYMGNASRHEQGKVGSLYIINS